VIFFSVVAVSAALRDDYSHAASFISELGAKDTPYADLMNYAGGLMLAAFGVALAQVLPRGRATMLAALLVA
jgi:hypothetical membrane protein